MGLAASQSRFLLLTARKNNLSSQMMSLTNQNMALQRQQSILSQKYEKQQNANYVTYNDALLDYSSIMQPGGVTGANQMFTSSAGEVLLNDCYRSKLSRLNTSTGSGSDFIKKYSEDEFLKAMMPMYDPVTNNGGVTSTSSTTSSSKTGSTSKTGTSSIVQDSRPTSAFKYDDSIMNDAVVNVQASAVLDMGGYTTDSEGNKIEGASLEYAMGTQQDNVNSLACIKTLNDYQYTEPNVQSVVNEFVYGATSTMAETMISNFGTTDAINQALEYACKMTAALYQDTDIYAAPDANFLQCVKFASDYLGYEDNNTYIEKFKNSEMANIEHFYTTHADELDKIPGLTDSDKQNIRNHNYSNNALYCYAKYVSQEVPLNTTGVLVSETSYTEWVTTNPSTKADEISYHKTEYKGKNVFVNTAQLTATFLNFFDAEMNRQLGTTEGEYYADVMEKMILGATNQLDLRNNLQEEGIAQPSSLVNTDGTNLGAIDFTAKNLKGDINSISDDLKVIPGTEVKPTGITYTEAVNAANLSDATERNDIPLNLMSAARAILGISNEGTSYNDLYRAVGTGSNDVWSVLGNEAKAEYEATGKISMKDAKGLVYTLDVKNYAKKLPTYAQWVGTDGKLSCDSSEYDIILHRDDSVTSGLKRITDTWRSAMADVCRDVVTKGISAGVYTVKGTNIGGRTFSYVENVTPASTYLVTNYGVANTIDIYNWWDHHKTAAVTSWTAQAGFICSRDYTTRATEINNQKWTSGPSTTNIGGQVYAVNIKVDEDRAKNINLDGLLTVENPLASGEVVVPDLETCPVGTALSNQKMEYMAGTLAAGQSITVQANIGDMKRFSIAGGMVEYSLNENTFANVDSGGNRTWTITNHSNVSQEYSYYQTEIDPVEDAKQAKNKTKTGGTKVSGVIGDSNLLSDNFSSGAAGVFGSKNLSGDDFKNYSQGSKLTGGSSGSGEVTSGDVQYYKSLYSALATGGWKVDSQANNSSYLSQQMLQGNVVLNTFSSSRSWSALQLGDANSKLSTVEDKEAREKAKAEYEAQNAILETRKTFLENQIQTLQTQSDAIDTEKDSLKSLIETEQEKFKLFV